MCVINISLYQLISCSIMCLVLYLNSKNSNCKQFYSNFNQSSNLLPSRVIFMYAPHYSNFGYYLEEYIFVHNLCRIRVALFDQPCEGYGIRCSYSSSTSFGLATLRPSFYSGLATLAQDRVVLHRSHP